MNDLAPPPHTPMMQQYLRIKSQYPDILLFYRMGDFYEMFFEDAEVASRVLGIVLTKRGKHLGRDIPMCGVPIERADEYLHRLIAHGHRVAVCEQTEDPAEAKKRGGKSVVRRRIFGRCPLEGVDRLIWGFPGCFGLAKRNVCMLLSWKSGTGG